MGAASARILVIACSVLLVVACTPYVTAPATLLPGSLTRDQAIAAAIRQAPPGMADPAIGWAAAGQNPFVPGAGPVVWLVRLEGAADIPSCAPGYMERPESRSDDPCLDDDLGRAPTGLTAVVDPLTGTLLGWHH